MPTNPYGWLVDPIEPLTWLTDRVLKQNQGCYLRFNDGEAYSMTGQKRAPESNGEHGYTAGLRRDLGKTFVSACADSVTDSDLLVGSWWYEDPHHPAAYSLISCLAPFGGYESGGLIRETRWGRGHIWHREELEREGRCLGNDLITLMTAIREAPRTCRYLVGNGSLTPVAKALNAQILQIPHTDAWGWLEEFPYQKKRYQIMIWCAGMPAKNWIYQNRLFEFNNSDDPLTIHIDAGSLFDGLVGRESREWLKREPETAHSRFYYGEFARFMGIEKG